MDLGRQAEPGAMKRVAAWMLCVLAALAPAVRAQTGKPLPMPDIAKGVTLRVAYVHNPRFPALPADQLNLILLQTADQLQKQLGLKVAFTAPVELPIIKVFAALNPRIAAQAEALRLEPTTNEYALERLAKQLLKDLQQEGDIAAQKRFAASYLLPPPVDDSDIAFARALVQTQQALLRNWQRLKGADGQPLIGVDRFNEYAYWNVLGSTQLPYEVLVTNQLIASAEWEENSVHSAIRGGVSNGVTTQSRAGRFKLVSVLSTFPFLDNSPETVQLRGGETPTVAVANTYMAALLAHELGHQLLHLGHPFGNPHCLMTPPVVLRFKQWLADLSPSQCALGSSKGNTPGVIKFASPEAMFR
ncbi:MAG: hypothetical protein H7346_20710 [Burkholderiaceae bacterium]|nr:hypothetical protein [Burkholderiaceae bacterium]